MHSRSLARLIGFFKSTVVGGVFVLVPVVLISIVIGQAATSAEADAIFSVIEPLTADEATEDQKKHAVALGVVAARLPHGQRDATIQKLISLAARRPHSKPHPLGRKHRHRDGQEWPRGGVRGG